MVYGKYKGPVLGDILVIDNPYPGDQSVKINKQYPGYAVKEILKFCFKIFHAGIIIVININISIW